MFNGKRMKERRNTCEREQESRAREAKIGTKRRMKRGRSEEEEEEKKKS